MPLKHPDVALAKQTGLSHLKTEKSIKLTRRLGTGQRLNRPTNRPTDKTTKQFRKHAMVSKCAFTMSKQTCGKTSASVSNSDKEPLQGHENQLSLLTEKFRSTKVLSTSHLEEAATDRVLCVGSSVRVWSGSGPKDPPEEALQTSFGLRIQGSLMQDSAC